MNYFVNENIFTLNSGTEFSAVKRLRLFKNHGLPAKIVTRNYNSNLEGDLRRVGLTHADVINMYDYFQEVTDIPCKDLNVRYADVIDKTTYHIEGVDANESLIKYHGDTVAKVSIAPATVGLVGNIEYYNSMNVVEVRDMWDRRGFRSSTQYLHPDGKLGPQVFYNFDGVPKLEITHMNINGVLAPTMFKLLDYQGHAWRFNSEEELFAFFLNELAKQEPSVFINDRPSLIAAVASIQGAAGKWQCLHNVHSQNNNQVGASRQIIDYLQPLFNNFVGYFDGVIVSTEQQKEEIQKVSKFKKVLALPDTYSEPVKFDELESNEAKRDKNKIVYLGRIAADKGTIDTIEIFSKIHRKLPETRLEYFGYASPAEVQKQVEEAAEKHGVKDFVSFRGYQPDEILTNNLKEASLLLNTSPAEAFGMTVLQAMNYGLPVVAYKVKYGLSDLIESGVSGELVPLGNAEMAANVAVSLLDDNEKWSRMSRAAYEKAQEFDETAAWNKWLNTKQAAENLFVEDTAPVANANPTETKLS